MNSLLRTLSLIVTSIAMASSAHAQESPRVASLPEGAIVPDAEVDGNGIVHVVYLLEGNVFYVRSTDEGLTFTNPIRVNTEADFASGAGFRGPDLALGKDERVHVIWYNAGYQQKRPRDQWGVMYSRLHKDEKQFEEARNLNKLPSDNFSLAADSAGRVAVIWMAGGVFATLSKDGGKSFSPATKLEVDPCECCGSRAIYAPDGALSVLYRDKTDNLRDTNLARLPAGSAKWTSRRISETPWPIDSCPMTGSFLSLTKKGLAAAWETKNQPFFAFLDDAPKETKAREIRAAKKGRYPIILVTAKGLKLAAWKNEKTLEWQLFDSTNSPTGKRGSYLSASPHRPAGVVTKSGTFILFP